MNKQELYIEKYKTAPQEIKHLMSFEGSIDTLRSLWETYDIEDNHEQCKRLSFEIGCVLLGVTHPRDFIKQLEQELGVSPETARSIAKDVNEKMFSQVKDLLIEIHNLRGTASNNIETKNTESPKIPATTSTGSPDLFEKKLKQSVLAAPAPQSTKIPVTNESGAADTPQLPSKDSYREPIE
jgi:hypothetical protein